MHPDDREKTAIITHNGLFHFVRMPFGLCNAPATFLRVVDQAFRDCIRKFIMPYFDDITIYSTSFEDHLTHIRETFNIMRNIGFRAKPSKCRFGYEEIQWMSFIISGTGIKPDPLLVDKIKRTQVPTNAKEVLSFVQLCNYYRVHINNFAKKSACLYDLTQPNIPFVWTSEHQKAFDLLKTELCEYPTVRLPDFTKPFNICTDASDYAVGGILQQTDENKKDYVIAYYSRKLSNSERKLSTFDKEALALSETVKKFDHYLRGHKFIVYTDHMPLIHLKKLGDKTGKLGRLSIELFDKYEFDVLHKPGHKNTNADALSRLDFAEEPSNNETVTINNVNMNDTKTSLIPFAKAQKEDSTLKILYEYIKSNKRKLPDDNKIRDEILWYTQSNYNAEIIIFHDVLYRKLLYKNLNSIRGEEKQIYQLLMPNNQTLKYEILNTIHITAGHCGNEKLIQLIRHRFYWKNMNDEITNFVKSCHICQITKTNMDRSIDSKQSIISQGNDDIKFLQPFSQICIDHIHMPKIKGSEYKYILTVIDRYSRFAQAYPVKTVNAEETVEVLINQWMLQYGFPRTILHDNGSAFISELMNKVCKIFDCKQIKSTAYNPQSHGLIERFNQTIEKILRSLIEQHQEKYSKWTRLLPQALFCYNYCINKTTGYSPYKLAFGRDLNAPIDLILNDDSIFNSKEDYLNNLANDFRITHSIVIDQLLTQQQKYEMYNIKHADKIKQFNVGDHVLLAQIEDRKFKKLSSVYYPDPFIIKEKLNDITVYIEPLSEKSKLLPMNVNIRRLKHYYDNNEILNEIQSQDNLINSAINNLPQLSQDYQPQHYSKIPED
ncbi:MAG: RNase H-like domain-containing protein [Nitrososphaeraceae archaeon]